MFNRISRFSFHQLGHCLVALSLLGLVFPPALLADAAGGIAVQQKVATDAWPDYFTVSYASTGVTYEYFKQDDGSLFYRSDDSSQIGSVPASVLGGINITSVTENGPLFDSTFTVADGSGGTATYQFYGYWDAATGVADGTLVTPSGNQDLQLVIPDNTGDVTNLTKAVVIVIVIGAGAVGAIGCIWHALATDCAADCAAACAVGGGSLKSSSEGWCGRCTCKCNPPPPRCNDKSVATTIPGDTIPSEGPVEACPVYEALAVPVSAFR